MLPKFYTSAYNFFTFWFSTVYHNVVQTVSTSIRLCRLLLHRIHFVKKNLSWEAVNHSAGQNNSVYYVTSILIAVFTVPNTLQ